MTTTPSAKLPLVALVGRPNVGKSSLFNVLLGERRAITDAMPGVTRDPIEREWDLETFRVNLVDTGGYQTEGDDLDKAVTRRSLAKAAEADLILLLLDLGEVIPEDEIFLEKLRPYAPKTILVVNKVDTYEKENQVFNFYQYGFETVVGISAAHRRNIDLLEDEIRLRLGHWEVVPGEEVDTRLAILGKPNAGKSTLTNLLMGEELSIVSPIAGTTRDVIEGRFERNGRRYQVMDTAGIRKKARVVEDVEYYSVNRAIKSIKDADVVILLVDAVEGLTEQDKKIAAQVVKEGRGFIIALNKWDLLPRIGNQVESVVDRIRFLFPQAEWAPILPLSAKNGTGTEELLRTASRLHQQLLHKVDTPRLNEVLKAWMVDQPLHGQKGKTHKIRYLSQVHAHPVRFVAFVNQPKGFPSAYIQYIKNRIRKDLGFREVPFDLDVRA